MARTGNGDDKISGISETWTSVERYAEKCLLPLAQESVSGRLTRTLIVETLIIRRIAVLTWRSIEVKRRHFSEDDHGD